MDRKIGFELLREVLYEVLAIDPEDITEESEFRDDLGADSLDVLEVATEVESRLAGKLPEDQLRKITTVGQVLDLMMAAGDRIPAADG